MYNDGMADATSELEVVIQARDEASDKLKQIGISASSVGKTFTIAGGAITGALGFAIKAAAEAQTQMAQVSIITDSLGDVAAKAGIGIGDLQKQFVDIGDSAVRLGFDNEAVSLSMARLAKSTGDVGVAQKATALAMDLARAKGIDLESATKAINLALQGSPKILREYGIELGENASKTEILSALTESFGGTAEKMTGTLAVQIDSLQQQFGNIVEAVGEQLLPILTDLLKKIQPVIEGILAWSEAHPELTKGIVLITAGIGGLMLVLGPLLLLLPSLTAAVSAFGAVFLFVAANPIVLIIAGLVALGVAIALLIQNWDAVRAKTEEIWKSIQSAISLSLTGIRADIASAITFITQFMVNGLNIAKDIWSSVWQGIKDAVFGTLDSIMVKVSEVMEFIASKLRVAQDALSTITSIATAPIRAAGAMGAATGRAIGRRQEGGLVSAMNPFMVGEAGPELFIPRRAGAIAPAGGFGGGMTFNITITGNSFMSDEQTAIKIGNMIVGRLKLVSRIGL